MAIQILHRIGTFNFIQLIPVPPRRKRRVFTETRPGVDGFAMWYEAERGEVWQPTSIVDAQTHTLAQNLKSQYEDAVSQFVDVTYADLAYPKMLIQDVEVQIQDQVYGQGGYAVNTRALVVAQWTMLVQ